MTTQELLNRVRELNRELPTAIPAIIQQTSYEIEALNKQQLYQGVTSDDSKGAPQKIEPRYKSKYYSQEKNYMNRRPGWGVPDLFLTGAFYQGFTVSAVGYGFKVDSVNSKSEGLKKRYGTGIFGLTRSNIKVYATGIFYTELKKFITLKTGLPIT